jgi:hypothetical protein
LAGVCQILYPDKRDFQYPQDFLLEEDGPRNHRYHHPEQKPAMALLPSFLIPFPEAAAQTPSWSAQIKGVQEINTHHQENIRFHFRGGQSGLNRPTELNDIIA